MNNSNLRVGHTLNDYSNLSYTEKLTAIIAANKEVYNQMNSEEFKSHTLIKSYPMVTEDNSYSFRNGSVLGFSTIVLK